MTRSLAIKQGPPLPELREQAEILANSDIVPRRYHGRPQEIVAAALYGAELGFSPVVALRNISFIEGQATLSAEAMRALVLREGIGFFEVTITHDKVEVTGVRTDGRDESKLTRSFGFDDAYRAGLIARKDEAGPELPPEDGMSFSRKRGWYRGPWYQYPKDMMLARATSAVCRGLFSDVLAGVSYTPEEMEAVAAGSSPVLEATVVPQATLRPPDLDDLGSLHQAIYADLVAYGKPATAVARYCEQTYDQPNWWLLDSDQLEQFSETVAKKLAEQEDSQ